MDKEKEILEGLLKKFAKEIGNDIDVNEMMKKSKDAARDIDEMSEMIISDLMEWTDRHHDEKGWMAKVLAGMSRSVCFMLAMFDDMQDEDCKMLPSETFNTLLPLGMVVANKEVAVIKKKVCEKFVHSNAN